MRLDFEEIRKYWEDPVSGEHARTFRKNLIDGVVRASEYQTRMITGGMEVMNKMHELWVQGVDRYLDAQKKWASYLTERLTPPEN